MQFKKNQKVKIVGSSLDPDYAKYIGCTAKVYCDGPDANGLVSVKGLDSKFKEKVLGYIAFEPHDLQKV